MKKIVLFAAIALLTAYTASVSSCEKYVLPELSLSTDTLLVNGTAQFVDFQVKSNVQWQILDPGKYDWIYFDPYYGDESADIKIEILANEEAEERSVLVEFKSETILKNLYVCQQPL